MYALFILNCSPYLLQFHTLVVSQCSGLLSSLSPKVTASQQLGILTSKLQQMGAHHPLLAFPPATQALALLSLEMELFSKDWLQPTLWMQTLAKVIEFISYQVVFNLDHIIYAMMSRAYSKSKGHLI